MTRKEDFQWLIIVCVLCIVVITIINFFVDEPVFLRYGLYLIGGFAFMYLLKMAIHWDRYDDK